MMSRHKFLSSILCFIALMSSCKDNKHGNYTITKSMIADSAMVVSAHPIASQIGVDVLKKGGNCIDAAIAVQFALAVCYPQAGNIGGGGFLVYRNSIGQSVSLDFREKAPLSASTNMYLDSNGNVIPELSTKGRLAAGIPGSVAGLYESFKMYSKLKNWAMLIQPAIDLAEKGYFITDREAENLNKDKEIFSIVNKFKTAFTTQNWKQGDKLIQKQLAKTLVSIRDHKADGFYKGWVAEAIISDQKNNGGIITAQDLAEYKAIWRPTIKFNYKGYTIHTMGPPSSGGIILCQLLKSIEPFNFDTLDMHAASNVHLMVEAERRAYADRATHLGDSDFYPVPKEQLMDSSYIASRMKSFNVNFASVSDSIQAGKFTKESDHTTHISIVDQYGESASITTTLNGAYGSHAVVEGAGFILNNEMDDFSAKPGVPNSYGLIGAEANKIEPSKRMLSAMTPTIVDQNGKLKYVVGTPGGSTIITSVFQMIVDMVDFHLSATDAVQTPRFHHQWKPDAIHIEDNCLTPDVRNILQTMGHKVTVRDKIGRVEAIKIRENGQIEGAADPRGDDDANGF